MFEQDSIVVDGVPSPYPTRAVLPYNLLGVTVFLCVLANYYEDDAGTEASSPLRPDPSMRVVMMSACARRSGTGRIW